MLETGGYPPPSDDAALGESLNPNQAGSQLVGPSGQFSHHRCGHILAWLRRGFWVDLAQNQARQQSFEQQLSLPNELDIALCSAAGTCRNEYLGWGSSLTREDIKNMYVGFDVSDGVEKVFLVLKLALALLAYGYSCVDAEILLTEICVNISLPAPCLDFGARTLQVSFGHGPTIMLYCSKGIVLDKLVAVTRLAYIAATRNVNIHSAVNILDDIQERPHPYGWLVEVVNFQCLSMTAAVAAFMGSYSDALATALVAPFVIAVIKLCSFVECLNNIELLVVPMTIGVATSLVWSFIIVDAEPCHVLVWYSSVMLVFFPGSQLIYGAYEIGLGSVVHGATRLVSAIIRCMVLAVGLTIGWQVFGHWIQGGPANLPPGLTCNERSISWLTVFGVLNFPMLFFAYLGLNMRLRDMLGPFLVAYPTLFVYAFMVFGPNTFGVPQRVKDCIAMFIGGNLGSLYEYLTGVPSCIAIIPVILILAPGAGAVYSVINVMHTQSHEKQIVSSLWGELVLQGVCYGIGLYLAIQIWRPINRRRFIARGKDLASPLDISSFSMRT